MSDQTAHVREHMEIVGSDGQHVGTVDKIEGDRIKLTKSDDPDGSGQHHHYIPASAVQTVKDGRVYLDIEARHARENAAGKGQGPESGMKG